MLAFRSAEACDHEAGHEAGLDHAGAALDLPTRAHCLAAGLRALGLPERSVALVLCCERHEVDALVATEASCELGLDARRLPVGGDQEELDRITPVVVFACEEGTAAWRERERRGLVIGEGPGVMWWRAVEMRSRNEMTRDVGLSEEERG